MVGINLMTSCQYVGYIYDMTWNNPTHGPTCLGYLIKCSLIFKCDNKTTVCHGFSSWIFKRSKAKVSFRQKAFKINFKRKWCSKFKARLPRQLWLSKATNTERTTQQILLQKAEA